MQEDLYVTKSCVIRGNELHFRATTSGGPGGQHANKTSSRVELTFNINKSRSLGPRQKARLIDAFGPVIRVIASEQRSQLQNRERARQRLAKKLANALRVRKPRRPTKPTQAAKERRLQTKKRRTLTKIRRRRVANDE